MKRALVTLVIGDKYIQRFKKYCAVNWKEYANKYNYDVVVIDNYIDASRKAKNRSPSWQKCLILQHEKVKEYDRVIWIDSDVVINFKNAPDISEGVPLETVGAVDQYSILGRNIYLAMLKRCYIEWEKQNINFIKNLSPSDYHKVYGLLQDFNHVVQTGVMVLSPEYHNKIISQVYEKYDDRGGPEWNYEMRPLSYELQLNFDIKWLDYRFNFVWPVFQQFAYPFFRYTMYQKVMQKFGIQYFSKDIKKFINTAFKNSYFLHFAGSQGFIKYVID